MDVQTAIHTVRRIAAPCVSPDMCHSAHGRNPGVRWDRGTLL